MNTVLANIRKFQTISKSDSIRPTKYSICDNLLFDLTVIKRVFIFGSSRVIFHVHLAISYVS